MKSLKFVLVAILATVALAGCGKKEVGFDTLESARKQAKENAEFNARAWRAQTPVTADFGIISRGDSSQTPDCPQGDGWASIDLINVKTAAVQVKLKCSTVSDSVGCRADNDFKSSPFANEDGRCQATSKVPFPLPKIAK
jgi:hypothetical protein